MNEPKRCVNMEQKMRIIFCKRSRTTAAGISTAPCLRDKDCRVFIEQKYCEHFREKK